MDSVEEMMEKIKKERGQVQKPKVTNFSENSDLTSDPLSHLSGLTNCCPENQNRVKLEDGVRKNNILNDFINSMINQYPENVRDQILKEVQTQIKGNI